MNYVFPAAGLGKRFRDIGIETPKPLIRVHNVPLLIWAISNFPIKTNDQIWIISQSEHEIEIALKSEFPRLHKKCRFITIETITDGPATTVALAAQRISDNEPLVIANTDQYVFGDLLNFIEILNITDVCGSILTMEASGNQWSYISRGITGEVNFVVEKKQISNEATIGIYGFKTSKLFLNAYNRMREAKDLVNKEFYVAPMFNYLIDAKCEVVAKKIGKIGVEVFGTGTPVDLSQFERDQRLYSISKDIKAKWI